MVCVSVNTAPDLPCPCSCMVNPYRFLNTTKGSTALKFRPRLDVIFIQGAWACAVMPAQAMWVITQCGWAPQPQCPPCTQTQPRPLWLSPGNITCCRGCCPFHPGTCCTVNYVSAIKPDFSFEQHNSNSVHGRDYKPSWSMNFKGFQTLRWHHAAAK